MLELTIENGILVACNSFFFPSFLLKAQETISFQEKHSVTREQKSLMRLKIGVENTPLAFVSVQLQIVEFRMDFERFCLFLSNLPPIGQMADQNLSLMVNKLSLCACVDSEVYGQWFL